MQAFLLKHWPTLALALALLASLSFAAVQTSRLSSTQAGLKAAETSVQLLTERVNSDRSLIASRDILIARQNSAVDQLVNAAKADRTAYLARIDAADKVAKTYEASATSLLARQTEATDELGRARAALALIRETLAAERTPDVNVR